MQRILFVKISVLLRATLFLKTDIEKIRLKKPLYSYTYVNTKASYDALGTDPIE